MRVYLGLEIRLVFFFVQCHKTSCPGKPVCLDYAIRCFNFTLVCKLDKLLNTKESLGESKAKV